MMLFTALTLAQLLSSCAPSVGARTMTAVIRVESGGRPLAIHDNTLHRSFSPRDVNEGVAWATQLLALHHSVDLGLSQINDVNLPRLGMSVRDAFDPCENVRGAATILAADYRMASARFGPGQLALRRALGAYNSGSLFAGDAYIDKILQAAGIVDETAQVVPDLEGVTSPPLPSPAPEAVRPLPVASPVAVAAPTPTPIATANPYRSPILTGAVGGTPAPSPTPASANAPVVLTPERPPKPN